MRHTLKRKGGESPLRSTLNRIVHTPLFWLAILYISVGVIYALVTPVFEKPDEDGHYGYILYLREQRALPPLIFAGGFPSEYKQPPLYYWVATLLTRWLPADADPERLLLTNPYMDFSVPGYRNDNRNVFLHPPHTTPLILGARLVSLLFGLGTMVAAYYLASQLSPQKSLVPIATAAVVGFQPKFMYIATAISNDVAAAFLGALAVALLVRRLQTGDFSCFAVLMGGILGLASITKVSGLVFFPLTGLALLLIHRGFHRSFFRDGLVVLVVVLLVGGWWYVRNTVLYGDPLSTNVHAASAAQVPPFAERFWRDLSSIERTFWANLSRTFVSPTRLDKVFVWWGRTSLVFLAFGLVFNRAPRLAPGVWLVLFSWPLTFLLLLITYWAQEGAWAYGRLLFPAIAPLALFFVLGWSYVFPAHWQRVVLPCGAGVIVIVSVLVPFLSIYPLYHPWREWVEDQVEHTANVTYVEPTTGDKIAQLVGYSLPEPYALPGSYFLIELCWQPLAQTGVPYTMLVQLLDLSPLNVHGSPGVWGGRRTYPGLGNLPTDRWTSGRPFCDQVLVHVSAETPTPMGAAIEIGFFDRQTGARLRAENSEGDSIDLAVVRGVPILPPDGVPTVKRPARYVLDEAIGLDRVQLSGPVDHTATLTLTWQSLQSVSYDATVFVHLMEPGGDLVAQADRQPLDGRFPTSYWLPGQVVTDVVSLSPLPAVHDGELVLSVGMYTWPSLERLAVVDASGAPQLDDMAAFDVSSLLTEKEAIVP
jgi:4-amino-4-deoxy-L-arabinose transferase-like glycosyltransferase